MSDTLALPGARRAAPLVPGATPMAGRVAAILLADWRQRSRSMRFRVMLALAALVAWYCFPPLQAGYLIVAVGDHHRGFYSSAWVGMTVAMTSMLWSLIGFYLVRGTVQRDFETRVWQLLGASSMSRAGYLFAKWLSHVLVLCAILATALAVGLVAQWVRAEDRHLDVWELVKPSLFIALPLLALAATFAIWFDLVPVLRRTAGNVVFFFAWMTLLSGGAMQVDPHSPAHRDLGAPAWTSDLAGFELLKSAIDRQVAPQVPATESLEGMCVGCGVSSAAPRRFVWTRWDVDAVMLWGRLLWLAFAVGGVLLAVPLLDRLAAHRIAPPVDAAGRTRAPRQLRWLRAALAPLQRTALGTLVAAEAFVALRMRAWWWWTAWLAAAGVELFGSAHAAALALLGAWALLLDTFSRAGLREREHGTTGLVLTAPGAERRLLQARIGLLVGLAWVAALPALASHPAMAPLALAIGAALALGGLASGAVTRSSRPFELVFLVAAYATTQGLPWLDASAHGAAALATHTGICAVSLALLRACWSASLR